MQALARKVNPGIIELPRTAGVIVRFPTKNQEDVLMTGQQKSSNRSGIPQLMKTLSAVTHTLLAAAVIWVGSNINNTNITVAKFSSEFGSMQKQQESMMTELRELHDSFLVMSSTYATKDDVADNVETIKKDIEQMKGSILVLEGKVQALTSKEPSLQKNPQSRR